MYCSNCGKQMNVNANFCENCGNKINNARELLNREHKNHLNEKPTFQDTKNTHSLDHQVNQSTFNQDHELKQTYEDLTDEGSTEDSVEKDMLKYVGKNSDYYHEKWKTIAEKKNGVSWNFAAFFLSTIWLGYRKMYKEVIYIALFFLSFDLLLYFLDSGIGINSSFVESVNNSLVYGLAAFVGLYGNNLYQKNTRKNALLIRNTTKDFQSRDFMLKQKGGTSWGGVFIALGIMLVFYVLPATFIPFSSYAVEGVKSGTFYDYPNVTVEDLFNTVFDDTSWDGISGTGNDDLVEFSGIKNAYDDDYSVKIQFMYDGDEFEVYNIIVDGDELDEYELYEFLDYIFYEYDSY